VSFIKHNPIPIHPVEDAAAILLKLAFFPLVQKFVMVLLPPKIYKHTQKKLAKGK
jgi:hypothetical protein